MCSDCVGRDRTSQSSSIAWPPVRAGQLLAVDRRAFLRRSRSEQEHVVPSASVRKPHPSLWIGGGGPKRHAETGGEYGDAAVIASHCSTESLNPARPFEASRDCHPECGRSSGRSDRAVPAPPSASARCEYVRRRTATRGRIAHHLTSALLSQRATDSKPEIRGPKSVAEARRSKPVVRRSSLKVRRPKRGARSLSLEGRRWKPRGRSPTLFAGSPEARKPGCLEARMRGCLDARMSGSGDVRKRGCPEARKRRCPEARMSGSADARMPGSPDSRSLELVARSSVPKPHARSSSAEARRESNGRRSYRASAVGCRDGGDARCLSLVRCRVPRAACRVPRAACRVPRALVTPRGVLACGSRSHPQRFRRSSANCCW